MKFEVRTCNILSTGLVDLRGFILWQSTVRGSYDIIIGISAYYSGFESGGILLKFKERISS